MNAEYFATPLNAYAGFVVLMEPHDTDAIGIQDPVMQLCCLDASIGMKPIVEKYRNVVITSGTECLYLGTQISAYIVNFEVTSTKCFDTSPRLQD